MSGPSPEPKRLPDGVVDCLVVGGGPAGLTAALYLRRFALSVVLVDAGQSRAASIPRTRNQPAFPGGITGQELVARMRQQVELHGLQVRPGVVISAKRAGDGLLEGGFLSVARIGGTENVIRSRTLLLATGITDKRPASLPDALHDEALALGRIRYCPICDGFEARDRRIAVLGTGDHGMREAVFLRSYSPNVTLVAPDGPHTLSAEARDRLSGFGITLHDGPVDRFALREDGLAFETAGYAMVFESVYPALGAQIHSGLARALGAVDDTVCIPVDDHGRTRIEGLYAAGDVTLGLDQIATASAVAAAAATAIRNDLADRTPLRRPVEVADRGEPMEERARS